jgi:hypothetical protein
VPLVLGETAMAELRYPLGAKIRPRDAREDRWHLARLALATAVDLNQPRLLADVNGQDCRPPILDQGRIGACAAFAAATAAYTSARAQKARGQLAHPGWVYAQARMREGTFPQDAGSYPADDLDVCRAGAPLLEAAPYDAADAADAYPQLDAAPRVAVVDSHRPFYPSDGAVLENVWRALDAGWAIVVGMLWTEAFYHPQRGVLPVGATPGQALGGHALTIWGIVPGYLLCQNQWTAAWTADAPASGLPGMRPGDVAVPWEYATNGIIFELRAVVPKVTLDDPLARARAVVDGYAREAAAHPRSLAARYRLQGAQAVLTAVEGGA